MALENAPKPIDITAIQFKAHSKYQLYDGIVDLQSFNSVNLLATASTLGLLITGRPTEHEIQVAQLSDVVARKDGPNIPMRTIKIPGAPYMLALSCDHETLSVCYTMNGSSFIDLYSVRSFLSINVACTLSKVLVSNVANVKVSQILWNPIIANTMALCLSDGTLGLYVFKGNSFEYNSLSPSENIRCACWSPKGKQIVAACGGGKLAQFKPDLKLAKTIPCEVQLFPGPYTPIAIQWLSTYQFGVVFVEQKDDAQQALFIVNAPKNSKPTYVNYYDITYSQSGPRTPQVFLVHILQWNLLLVASSNGTELGILGTNESGETPLWTQYNMVDEGRAELPLTPDNQDTFATGLVLETGSTHRIMIGENQIPVMPMIHILSTHGLLLSFNILNFLPTQVDICSPPQPIADKTAAQEFRMSPLEAQAPPSTPPRTQSAKLDSMKPVLSTPISGGFQSGQNTTFSLPEAVATSTPARPVAESLPAFNLKQTQKPSIPSAWPDSTPTMASAKDGQSKSGSKDAFKISQVTTSAISTKTETSEPLITIRPSDKPSAQARPQKHQLLAHSNSENDKILQEMLVQEITAFNDEVMAVIKRSRSIQINICGKDELSSLIKGIDEMQGIITQANESVDSMKADVQSLHLTLYEMLAMLAESQAKLRDFNNSASDSNAVATQMHRRLINKLQNLFKQTQTRYELFSKQLDANWSAHQQKQRENDKARMKIPTMENVYQTIRKQQQIMMREREKIKKIKEKIGGKATPAEQKIVYSYTNTENLKMSSLINSVLSMSIRDQMNNDRKTLDARKLDALRLLTLEKRQMNYVKPTRPTRNDLSSEFIIEKRIAYEREQQQKKQMPLAKPVASNETASVHSAPQASVKRIQPAKAGTIASNFGKTLLETPAPQQTLVTGNVVPKAAFPANDTVKPRTEFAATLSKPATASPAIELKGAGTTNESAMANQKPFSFNSATSAPSAAPTTMPAMQALAFNVAKESKPAGALLTALKSNPSNSVFGQPSNISGTVQAKDLTVKFPAPAPFGSPVASVAQSPSSIAGQLTTSIAPQKTVEPVSAIKISSPDVQSSPKVGIPKSSLFDMHSTPKSGTAPSSTAINSFSFSLNAISAPATNAAASPVASAKPAPTLAPASPQTLAQPPSLATPISSTFGDNTRAQTTSSPTTATNTAKPMPAPTTDTAAKPSADGPLFQGLSICKPNVSSSSTSIFGGATVSAAPPKPAGIFGGTSAAASSNIFGSKPTDTQQTQPPTGNIFGSKASEPASLSFSSFNLSSNGGSAAPATSTAASSTGNIFASPKSGQNLFVSSDTPTASMFGGAGTNTVSSSTPPTGLFGSVSSPASNAPASGTGNIFGGASATGSTSIFGGSSAVGSAAAQQTATSAASIFGSASASFGGFAKAAVSAAPAFGSPVAFQQPSFGQAGLQPACDAFGSPTQQPSSGGFGIGAGVPNQAFGSTPVFGGAPTLGTAKAGFGTFASVSPNTSFGSPQGNSLFESLGASNNTMTFGNLAQNQNTAPTTKPFSGGSSFSNWR